jgi:hypothetical protein
MVIFLQGKAASSTAFNHFFIISQMALNTEVACSFGTLVSTYNSTMPFHNPEYHNLITHRLENLKS